MNELEQMAGDLPPVIETDPVAEVALETSLAAVEIAQETLDTVQEIQEDTNLAWQTEVINKLDSIQNTLSSLGNPLTPAAAAPAETAELVIEEPAETETPPQQSKKTRKRRVTMGRKKTS